jgi:hypothetical protein
MRPGAWSIAHFALHGVIAVASEPVDNGADDEVGAKVPGKAIKLVLIDRDEPPDPSLPRFD